MIRNTLRRTFSDLAAFNKQYDTFQEDTLKRTEAVLSQPQKDKVKFIVSTVMQMTEQEKQYFRHLTTSQAEATYGVDLMSLRSDLPIFREHQEGPSMYLCEKEREQVEKSDQISRSLSQIFPSLSLGGKRVASSNSQPTEEVVEEDKVEIIKTNFDVELIAIDPTNKIKVIKEVRTFCGLGLKEAKEMVDKVPSLLLKQAIKEDADKIVDLLVKLGCTLNLK